MDLCLYYIHRLVEFQYIYSCASLPKGQYNIEVRSLPHSPFSDVKATAMIRVLGRDTGKSVIRIEFR